jgi:hypothetical protein
MDTLSVSTIADGDTFKVRYKYVPHGSGAASMAGSVTVCLAIRPDWTRDRGILAELAALHHLMYVREIHGVHRLGNSLCVEVSAGAIKKAVAKGALKKEDAGTTTKAHVAHFSMFLATKYFEATVEVVPSGKWVEPESKRTLDETICVDEYPVVHVGSVLGDVVVRRHALNRFVERFMAAAEMAAGRSLVDIPDYRWTRAWRSLESILPQSVRVTIPPKEAQRVMWKYGKDVHALHHIGSQNVFVVKDSGRGRELVTVLRGDEYCKLIELPRAAGQRLIYSG